MSMIDVQMQTPSPRLPRTSDDDSKTNGPAAPLHLPSASEGDDLDPYNLPFTD